MGHRRRWTSRMVGLIMRPGIIPMSGTVAHACPWNCARAYAPVCRAAAAGRNRSSNATVHVHVETAGFYILRRLAFVVCLFRTSYLSNKPTRPRSANSFATGPLLHFFTAQGYPEFTSCSSATSPRMSRMAWVSSSFSYRTKRAAHVSSAGRSALRSASASSAALVG